MFFIRGGAGGRTRFAVSVFFCAGVLLRYPANVLGAEPLRPSPTAATRFVKARVTMLHFPQAENSDSTLAFPLPTKQALWGPPFFSATGGGRLAPQTRTSSRLPATGVKKSPTPLGVGDFLVHLSIL